MYPFAQKALFCLPPELAHRLSLFAIDSAEVLGLSSLIATPIAKQSSKTVMGIDFPNAVGLAAGLDKNGDHIDGLAALGFGFIEIGTITPRPQAGNPKPRLFRIPQQQAIINRMGFNNKGVAHLCRQVEAAQFDGVIGINIGKNFDTPVEHAVDDYLACLQAVYPLATYITINLSSPNTPGLRDLQYGDPLRMLLADLKSEQQRLNQQWGRYVPLTVKIAPDMAEEDIEHVATALIDAEIDGVIATNTTIDHSAVDGLKYGSETGGLSGLPVAEKSQQVLSKLATLVSGKLALIGVGGICTGEQAAEKMAAGADLVQIYTGFIYQGPQLISDCIGATNKS